MIIEKQISKKLLTLFQKKDDDFYAYYHQIKNLFIRISKKDQVIYIRENIIILNNAKQYIIKDTIIKFCFGLKNPKFCLYLIQYRVNPICCFYGIFKKAEIYLDILNAKV